MHEESALSMAIDLLKLGGFFSTKSFVVLQEEGSKTVPLEVLPEVKHDKRGILSMGRHDDPNSGGSSFSILLGPAPHLDMQYTIFGCAGSQLLKYPSVHAPFTCNVGRVSSALMVQRKDHIPLKISLTVPAQVQQQTGYSYRRS